MRNFKNLVLIILILFFVNFCNSNYKQYVKSKTEPIKIYIEPTKVKIDIIFLRSISSKSSTSDKKDELIKQIAENHARWFDVRLRNLFLENNVSVVKRERADLVLEPNIVDMGEVRAKVFVQGLSIGLVFGIVIGELTGKPEVGFAVFVWEVIEEIIIVYLLKSYFMITTIDLSMKTPDGILVDSREFRSYSNDEFERDLPEFAKNFRENKVRGSLEMNARKISEYFTH